jgi:hydroxylamine reductase
MEENVMKLFRRNNSQTEGCGNSMPVKENLDMFCYQCSQTAKGTGCTVRGVWKRTNSCKASR